MGFQDNQSTFSIFENVRLSTEKVVQNARHVRWNPERLKIVANSFKPQSIIDAYQYDGDFYFKGTGEQLLNYVITLNAINFGSGLSVEWKQQRSYPGSSFKSTANGLRTFAEKGYDLNAVFAMNADNKLIASMLGVDPSFQLVTMFKQSLSELGGFVSEKYGSYANMISSLNSQNRAELLVDLLSSNLNAYHDVAHYNGFDVYFLKRAQILANDLFLAFEGKDFGEMGDISQLTMFADNLIPHYFRVENVLIYTDDLLEKINNGEKIAAGSPEEVEIRAFAVQCVEKLQELLVKKDSRITSAMIDYYLWQTAQDTKYKSLPRHRTVTFFY